MEDILLLLVPAAIVMLAGKKTDASVVDNEDGGSSGESNEPEVSYDTPEEPELAPKVDVYGNVRDTPMVYDDVTPSTVVNPSITPDVVPGNMQSQQEQATQFDVTPVNIAADNDVSDAAFANWLGTLKNTVYRTLETFGATADDLALAMQELDATAGSPGFVESFHLFLMGMEQKYGIDYNYMNSIMIRVGERP